MQKARILEALHVCDSEVKVEAEALVLKEQAISDPIARVMGITTEAALAFPNGAVSDGERALLTSEPIMADLNKYFDVAELEALLPEGYFMTFALNFEYELID